MVVRVLGFELIGQNKICVWEQRLVGWNYIFVDVELAIVAHDGIHDCDLLSEE